MVAPSVVLNTPSEKLVAYKVSPLPGTTMRSVIVPLSPSLTDLHPAPPLELLKIPPVVPTYTLSGCWGSIASAVVIPPAAKGPILDHDQRRRRRALPE